MSLLGAFRQSVIACIGQVRYARKPYYLTAPQKQRVRKRLRDVDSVVNALVESNIRIPEMDAIMKMKREHELKPREKYYVFSRNPKTHQKPITQVPHFTKTPHPRGFPPGYQ